MVGKAKRFGCLPMMERERARVEDLGGFFFFFLKIFVDDS